MNRIWTSIRRNPVINAFILAALAQLSQDYIAGDIDFAHILSYLATLCFGVMARGFAVPLTEHEDTIDNLHSAIDQLRKGEMA